MQYAGYEFLRIIFPRTPVNKGDIEKDRSFRRLRSFRLRASNRSEGYLLSSRGGWLNSPRRRSDPRLRSPLLLLLLLLALSRQMLRPGPDDHPNRRHYHQPPVEQNGYRGPSPKIVDDERYGKVNRGVRQDHHQEATSGAVVHPGEYHAQSEDPDNEGDVEGGSFNRISGQPQRQMPQTPNRRDEEGGTQGAHSALQTGQDVPPPPYLLAQRTAGDDGDGKEDRDAKQRHTPTQGRTSHEGIQEDHAPCEGDRS